MRVRHGEDKRHWVEIVTLTLPCPQWVQGVLVLILVLVLEGDFDERLL